MGDDAELSRLSLSDGPACFEFLQLEDPIPPRRTRSFDAYLRHVGRLAVASCLRLGAADAQLTTTEGELLGFEAFKCTGERAHIHGRPHDLSRMGVELPIRERVALENTANVLFLLDAGEDRRGAGAGR